MLPYSTVGLQRSLELRGMLCRRKEMHGKRLQMMNSLSTLKAQLNLLVPASGSWVLYARSEGLLLSFASCPSPLSPALVLVDGVHCIWVRKGLLDKAGVHLCAQKGEAQLLAWVPCLPSPHNVHQGWA